MKLVINKAKRETVADLVNGAALLYLLAAFGYCAYIPITNMIRAGKISSIGQLFPLNIRLLAPLPIFAMSILLFLISTNLKKDGTWISNIYEKLGAGILLVISLISVWIGLPLVGSVVMFLLNRK
jgi:hypothetical protein